MTYTLKIWYAATGEDDEPQIHTGLDRDRAEIGLGAFSRDLFAGFSLDQGVRRITIEKESNEND